MLRSIDQKIVLVTRQTQLESMRRKFGTPSQAKFQVVSAKKRELAAQGAPAALLEEQAVAVFREIAGASETYDKAVTDVRQMLDDLGVDLPVHPERQQILVTQPMPDIPPDFPFVIDFHQRLYFHREGAGLLSSLVDTDGLVELGEQITRVEPGHIVGFLPYASLI